MFRHWLTNIGNRITNQLIGIGDKKNVSEFKLVKKSKQKVLINAHSTPEPIQ